VVLIDTSVWVAHLRQKDRRLAALLDETHAAVHPFVIGELALGRLKNRREILSLLHALPEALVATQPELLHFIERRSLAGTGIGFVDAHLLASSELMSSRLWTFDKPLRRAARKLRLAYDD
jgi:predicted nucleic acid-binding protein